MRLPFLGQLTQAIKGALDLVDHVASGGGIVARELERIPLGVIGRLDTSDRTVEAGGQGRHRVGSHAA